MKCYNHPEADAIATCSTCGKAICQTCAVEVEGRLLCQPCLAAGTAPARQGATATTNPLAAISLALGVLGLLGCVCAGSVGGIVLGLPAAITGWIARKQLLQGEPNQQGIQLATAGLILGIAEAGLSILLLVFFGSLSGCALLSGFLEGFSY